MQSQSVRAPGRRLRVWPFSRPGGSSTISRFLQRKQAGCCSRANSSREGTRNARKLFRSQFCIVAHGRKNTKYRVTFGTLCVGGASHAGPATGQAGRPDWLNFKNPNAPAGRDALLRCVRLARTERAREQADVLAFANKNRGGCDALCHDPADIIDAVAVCARTTLTSARLSTLETSRSSTISRFLSANARVSA
jgi:hypothetical protein